MTLIYLDNHHTPFHVPEARLHSPHVLNTLYVYRRPAFAGQHNLALREFINWYILPWAALLIYKPLETAIVPIVPHMGTALHWYIFDVWKVSIVD